jgi:hypothetical protein
MTKKKKKPEDVMIEDLSLLREKLRTFMYLVSRLRHLEEMDEVRDKLDDVRILLDRIYMRETMRRITIE